MDPTTQRMMMSSSGGQVGIVWEDKSMHLSDGAGGIVSNLLDVELCGGVFIAVGASATILRSTDGISWTKISPPVGVSSTSRFESIAYSSSLGRIVVVGSTGIIYSNDAGLSWGSAVSGVIFYDVAFGNNRFVAVGGTGSASTIYYSTDGTSWTSTSAPAGVTEDLIGIAYGTPSGVAGGRWVAIGNGNGTTTTGARYIFSNDTGVTWTNIVLTATDNVTAINYAAGSINLYVVSGYTLATAATFIRTSAAGNATFPTVYTNTAQIGDNTANAIEYLNSTLVLVGGSNQVVTSTNGTAWTLTQPRQAGDASSTGIAYSSGLGRYVFVGSSSSNLGGFNTAIGASLRRSSSLLRSGTTIIYDSPALYGAVYVPSLGKYFVAGNSGRIYSSTDLSTWTGFYLSQPIEIRAFFFDGTRIIAAGSAASTSYVSDNSYIFSSVDGSSWSLDFTAGSGYSIRGGLYGGYNSSSVTHIIFGSGTPARLWYSTNGTSWSTMTPRISTYTSGAYINDPTLGPFPLAVLGASTNVIDLTSDPAVSTSAFETIPVGNTGGSSTSSSVTSVTYMQESNLGDSRLIYTVNRSNNAYLVTTPWATSFVTQSSGSASYLWGSTIAPPTGNIVVVGAQTIGSGFSAYQIPYLLTSSDSVTWTPRTVPGSTSYRAWLLGVVYTNNRYIAVGNNGVVLVSQL